MRKKINLAIVAASLLATASGCSTITKGSSQSLTVNTAPPGANCTVSREGMVLGIIGRTPGTLQIEKDKDTITVACHKEGYSEATGILDSSFQAMTFGNILFGGVIGLAVDGATGAMHQYPSVITVALTPESFDSLAARDLFFDRRHRDLVEEYTKTVAAIRKHCQPNEDCEPQVKEAERQMHAGLASLEQKRSQARVRQ